MADLSCLPSFLTCPLKEDNLHFRVQWPQLMWVHSCAPTPCKSHLCIMSKPRVSPELEARIERWSGGGIQETKPSEMKDAFMRAGQTWEGSLLQNREPLRRRAETWSVSLAVGRRPRAKLGKWRRHPKCRFQDKSLHPTLLIFFGRKACLFGGEMNPQY